MRPISDMMVFPTALGWMSMQVDRQFVIRLSFGHATPQDALFDLVGFPFTVGESDLDDVPDEWMPLVNRLQRYAEGAIDDFLDIELLCTQTPFQRRVVELCRQIPFGSSLTYGELAERAGHPRAARAVGNCMRTNSVPLIVPCHRVVGSGGSMRGYSAGEGVRMKLRLLEMEAAACVG